MLFRQKEGYALIAVLWVLVLLSVLVAGLSASSRQTTKSLEAFAGGVQARYLADGGIQLVILNLLDPLPANRLLGDGQQITVEVDDGKVDVVVTDENGKVDINAANELLLTRLFESLSVDEKKSEQLAAAIADYRDEDDLVRLNGVEDADYLKAGLTYGAKDALFTSVDELKQVLGMDQAIFNAIRPYVTVYAKSQGVNPEVAPLPVLMALSDDSVGMLESYVDQRRQAHKDGLPMPSAPQIDRQFISRTRGVTYSMDAVGFTEKGKQSGVTTTLRVRRGRNQASLEILAWKPYIKPEYQLTLGSFDVQELDADNE